MAQTLTPSSTVSNSTWSVTGASAHAALADASDATFVSATSGTQTLIVGLSAGVDPLSSADHTVVVRMDSDIPATLPEIAVRLMQGAVEIAVIGPHNINGTVGDYSHTITAGEADSITDYTALRLEIISAPAKGELSRVYRAYMEIPDAPVAEQDSLLTLGCS